MKERRWTETQLGKKWRAYMRAQGWWVLKLPASGLAGLPDYLIGRKGEGIRFVEAKRANLPGRHMAFTTSMLTVAQRFFLDLVGDADQKLASVLILDQEKFLELTWASVGEGISRRLFDAAARRYDSGSD